ncbi:centrosomal protein of 290 kDa isoform X1 [Telopea speciosissima]|uniref:centrosomal protein of 290 kDa isoform X1 n=1 Tax=Telopea speciosissima TaxID=54955 RepID=UPI001CC45766|nr:centrosomal protein of 290 kDa isoform X1 [Telopea speciosissima]
MAGLLAWAADVVGGGGQSNDEDESNRFPVVKFTPEQQIYARDLEVKAASLSRSIQDLRLRLPPPDISQRLPHLHAHSLASNAALALQLNAHSATREEAQLREAALQEENAAYEKAITNCEKRIQEKLQEADMLQSKLQEIDMTEKRLRAELETMQMELNQSSESSVHPNTKQEDRNDAEALKAATLEKLDNKKKELNSMEEKIKGLEEKWTQVQHDSLRKLSPAQREKILDKQLHSSIEQLAAKQAQAEGLVSEIHLKKLEFEKLNGLWKRLESGNTELNTARNRFVGSSLGRGSSDYIIDSPSRPSHVGGRTESQQRLMLLRSAFVLYILFLHVLVFIKISF